MNNNHTTHEELVKTLEHDLSLYGTGVVSMAGLELVDLRDEPVHGHSTMFVSLEEARDLEGTLDPFERMEAAYQGYGNSDIERGTDAQGGLVFGMVPTDRTAWENCDPADMAG